MENDTDKKKHLHEYTLEELINEVSLYYKIPISVETKNNSGKQNIDIDMFNSIFIGNANVMSYCIECKKTTAFNPISSKYLELFNSELRNRISVQKRYSEKTMDFPEIIITYNEYYTREYKCAYNNSHTLVLACKLIKDDNMLTIMKIGQYPPIVDLQFSEFEKYEDILKKKDFLEFKKALNLHSNGIGVGSFVYLRRIYENLIESIHQELKENINFDEKEYKGLVFDKKITKLESLGANIFPEEIQEFKAHIYSILGEGIHGYDEYECMYLFEPLKFCIESILSYKYEKEERMKKAEAVKKAFTSK